MAERGDSVDRREVLESDGGMAYVCRQWLSGRTQKDIAREFGYSNSASINDRLARFIFRNLTEPEAATIETVIGWQYRRRELAARALDNWARGRPVQGGDGRVWETDWYRQDVRNSQEASARQASRAHDCRQPQPSARPSNWYARPSESAPKT